MATRTISRTCPVLKKSVRWTFVNINNEVETFSGCESEVECRLKGVSEKTGAAILDPLFPADCPAPRYKKKNREN